MILDKLDSETGERQIYAAALYSDYQKNEHTENLLLKEGLMMIENDIDFGRQVLDCDAYGRLEDGVYELKITDDDIVISSAPCDGEHIHEYLNKAERDCFIFEKKNGNTMLLFPECMSVTKQDFIDNREEYNDIICCFESMTGCKEAVVVCNRVTGSISGLSTPPYSKRDFNNFMSFCSIFEFKSLNALEMEYAKKSFGRYMKRALQTLTPEVMLSYCQDRIQGQGIQLKKAVYMIYKYMQDIADETLNHAENWMLTAPSGSGKTEFFRAIRDLFKIYHIPIPVVQIDLSQITETGYKGENVSAIPQRILSVNPDSEGVAICFLDEADKKCVPSYSHNVNVNEAVQANLLTLVEGTQLMVDTDDDSKKAFDSNKTMFIFMGAFQSVRNNKQEKNKAASLGFCANFDEISSVDKASDDFYEDLTMQDLIDFGMLEELAGRMVQLVNFRRLTEESMRKLINCKVQEISGEMGFAIEISEQAMEELVAISFGSLGVRRPMNMIKELASGAVAEEFFEGGFNRSRDKVIIKTLDSAKIRHNCRLSEYET